MSYYVVYMSQIEYFPATNPTIMTSKMMHIITLICCSSNVFPYISFVPSCRAGAIRNLWKLRPWGLKKEEGRIAQDIALHQNVSFLSKTSVLSSSLLLCWKQIFHFLCFVEFIYTTKFICSIFVSSDRSSCTDDGLLSIYISAHFFRFSLSPLMQLMLRVSL